MTATRELKLYSDIITHKITIDTVGDFTVEELSICQDIFNSIVGKAMTNHTLFKLAGLLKSSLLNCSICIQDPPFWGRFADLFYTFLLNQYIC